MNNILIILLITVIFIILDVVTGIFKCLATKSYDSSKMRQGLYHKLGSILCISFSILCDFSQQYLDIGLTIPIAKAVCAYICIMEIGSIIENICVLNPDILPDKVKQYFKKLK